MAGRVERRLTTILAADVAEYSRLMRADEDGTLAVLTVCRVVVDRLIAQHRGRIANTAGDSILAEFPSVADGLSCALAMQETIEKHNAPISPGRQMRFRIGLHLGDVMIRDGDLFGDAVNIAARLQALARPGTVCISHTVYEQVRNKLDLNYHPLGSHRVKNIAEPIRAYVVGVPAVPGRRTGKRRRLLVAAAGASGLVAVSLVAWVLHSGVGRDLHACRPVALLCEVFARPSSAK